MKMPGSSDDAQPTGLPPTLGGACPLPGGGRGQAGSRANRPIEVSHGLMSTIAKGFALVVLCSACAAPSKSADANCFPFDTGDKICVDDSWRTDPSTFEVGSVEHSSGDVIEHYSKKSSFESKGLDRSTYLASITTNDVNGTLCDQSVAFDDCRSARRFTLSEGSVTSVFLTKIYADKECRTLNVYERNGISEFTVCGSSNSGFFENLNLREFANSVRQDQA